MNDPLSLSHHQEANTNATTSPPSRDGQEGESAPTPKSQWRPWHIIVVAILAVATILIIRQRNAPAAPYQRIEGAVFGTFYHITYQSNDQLQTELEAEMHKVDASLSMFNKESIISRVNRNEEVEVDSLFRRVFELSMAVSEVTEGAFDITVAPLVNAWGFGYKDETLPSDAEIDSLRQLVGWQRIILTADGHVQKADTSMVLDCSAVAKGFGVDLVAEHLLARGVSNFMVEIGGEVVVHGVNPDGKLWRVGISRPVEDASADPTSAQLEAVLPLTDCAMATSGNYRNFYIAEDGRKVAHTIDPQTGRPVQHSLLSATVLAPTCAEADAFATSFMVMGIERAKSLLGSRQDLQVYFIYDSLGTMRTYTNIADSGQ